MENITCQERKKVVRKPKKMVKKVKIRLIIDEGEEGEANQEVNENIDYPLTWASKFDNIHIIEPLDFKPFPQ